MFKKVVLPFGIAALIAAGLAMASDRPMQMRGPVSTGYEGRRSGRRGKSAHVHGAGHPGSRCSLQLA